MKRRFTLLTLFTLLCTFAAVSQTFQWNHVGVFPPSSQVAGDTIWPTDVHGLAVDPDGKIWVMRLGAFARDTILIPNFLSQVDTSHAFSPDSLFAKQVAVRALYVYNPNGTQAAFSPIFFAKGGGVSDTLGGASTYIYGRKVWWPTISANTGRGLRMDNNGNIIATYFGNLYRFNYKTGAFMNKGVVDPKNSGVSVGVSTDGYVYANNVSAGATPLKIFNPDLTFFGNAVDNLTSFSRAINVSSDGNDIYYSGYTNHAVYRYHSDLGVLGSYLTRVDTVMKGFDCESYCWNPKTHLLYASSGSYNDQPNRWPGLSTSYDTAAWYAYNPTTNTVGEKINWVFNKKYDTTNVLKANERPRAIAFSPGGDTAYVGVFGGGSPGGLRMFRRVPTGIVPLTGGVPSVYALTQNYPNPFNPTTEIQFTVAKAGMTSLKVFDILGREVATLVNQPMNPGKFRVDFDGKNLSSGTYIYVFSSGDSRITKKMMLLK